MKKILLLITIIILTSCSVFNELEPNTSWWLNFDHLKKNPKTDVKEDNLKEKILKEVMERPINKEVDYKGITLLIPKGTIIKKNNFIVDEATGINLPIYLLCVTYSGGRTGNYYQKIVGDKEYSINRDYPIANELFEKLGKANGFTKIEKR